MLGNGNGTFQPVQSYAGAGGSQVLAVDLNRDGRLDVAATNNGTLVYVLTGNGNGTLQAPTAYTVGSGSWGVVAADVNGDKIPDLVCANQNSNTISVLRGLGGSLSNGVHTFAAWAEDVAGNKSPVSPSLSATFDTIAPTADVLDVSPDPRDVPVDQVNIVFSEPVYGFDLGDVALTRNGLGVSLATATLTTSDNITWTVGNLGGATGQSGSYVLSLTATGTGITDVVGNALAAAASDAFKVQTNVITGTSGSDTYYLKSDGAGGILVYENNPNTSGPADYTIPAASVNSLTIDTGDGNDVVTFGTALPVAPALVGGTGNKTSASTRVPPRSAVTSARESHT